MDSYFSRTQRGENGGNTLDVPTVDVYFQMSPSWPDDKPRGIKGLDYKVMFGGLELDSGQTPTDGKIEVEVMGDSSELQLLYEGTIVARYTISVLEDEEESTSVEGTQRRLRRLGYHLGHDGDRSDGIDGIVGVKTDKAILDFQIDHGMPFDGVVGHSTRNKIKEKTDEKAR